MLLRKETVKAKRAFTQARYAVYNNIQTLKRLETTLFTMTKNTTCEFVVLNSVL